MQATVIPVQARAVAA